MEKTITNGSHYFPVRKILNSEYFIEYFIETVPQYFNSDRSKAVLLLWFLIVTCSCCPYLYFGSPIILVTYFSKF